MEYSVKYNFFMSQLTPLEEIKETDKIKISVVYHEGIKSSCILRVCKNRDLSSVCKALRKIRNPNTVVVHDFVYENGDTYILEENVDGNTVSEIMEDKGTFSEQSTAKIVVEVCKALEKLHQERPPVVHNDINPSNIKIREDGTVKLFDFDISRIYKKGQSQNTVLFGTEEFASPEHFGYGQSEPRTDIYCLGVTMHKMLTGQGLTNEHRIIYNGNLKTIINKCLEFDPKNRYASVHALRKDLEKFLSKKKGFLYTVLSILGIAIVSLGIVFALEYFRPNNEEGAMGEVGSNTTQATSEVTNPSTSTVGDRVDLAESPVDTDENHGDVTEPTTTTAPSDDDVSEPPKNDSRKNAWVIPLNQKLTGSLEEESEDWYKFTTSSTEAAYRLGATPLRGEFTGAKYTYLRVALFDGNGIKLEEFLMHCSEEYDFLDLYLELDTEYFVKVYGTDTGSTTKAGDYELCIDEKICDAGKDKESATELTLGVRRSATIDSSLSDWYVFKVTEDGRYTITLHNIDVGSAIYISATRPGSAREGRPVHNEDNYSWGVTAKAGDSIYLEISEYDDNPAANGTYILVIESE